MRIVDIPINGWRFVRRFDLAKVKPVLNQPGLEGRCDRCGRMGIRYWDELEHGDFPDHVHVGKTCSRRLQLCA